jgi:hypothetical protein
VYLCHELCIVFTFFAVLTFILQLVISVTFGKAEAQKTQRRNDSTT